MKARELTSRRELVRLTALTAAGAVLVVGCSPAAPPPTAAAVAAALPTPIPPAPTAVSTPSPPPATAVATRVPTAIPTPTLAPRAKVLIMLARWSPLSLELSLTKEVGVMADLLDKAGYKPVVAAENTKPVASGAARLVPDLKITDVKVDDYAGVLVPCTSGSDGFIQDEAIAIVKTAADQKKPVGAQHANIAVLTRAKLYTLDLAESGYPAGVVTLPNNVFVSGTCPLMAQMSSDRVDGTVELTQRFIAALKSAG